MAQPTSNSPAPVSEDAFTADRERMFSGFVSATTIGTVASAVILILMAVFLV